MSGEDKKKYLSDIINAIEHNAHLFNEDPAKRYADNKQLERTITEQCNILRKELKLKEVP